MTGNDVSMGTNLAQCKRSGRDPPGRLKELETIDTVLRTADYIGVHPPRS